MKTLNFAVGSLVALLVPTVAQAIVITNVTQSNQVIFYDDFEGVPASTSAALDTSAAYHPVADTGFYAISDPEGVNAQVTSFNNATTSGPGVLYGNNYLRMRRAPASPGSTLEANVSAIPNNGDHINVAFWAYMPAAPATANLAVFKLIESGGPGDGSRAGARATPGGVVADIDGVGTSLTYTPGVWEKWQFDYNIGASDYKLTVGLQAPLTIANTQPGRGGPGNISGLQFFNGTADAPQTFFFLDSPSLAVPPPPSGVPINGDFEYTVGWGALGSPSAGPAYWQPVGGNPATPQSGAAAIGGSGTSAYTPVDPAGGALTQTINTNQLAWTFDMDFAATDPGADGSRTLDLGLDMYFPGASQLGRVFMRVVDLNDDGQGDVQFHDPDTGGWTTVTELMGTVDFDDDVTTTPLVNHLEITPDPSSLAFNVKVTDSIGNIVTKDGITLFNNPSLAPATPESVSIFGSANGAQLFDNISITTVPEPTSIALFGCGLLGIVRLVRKRSCR